MRSIKSTHRLLLERSRRFRRWLSTGLGLPSGYVATLDRPRSNPAWREVKKPRRARLSSRLEPPARILVETGVSFTPEPPGCIQSGNPGGFPLGIAIKSAPAFVYCLPSVIYHGFHGATMDADGAVYTELLDGPFEELDRSQTKGRGMTFKGKVMALSCCKNYFHWLLKMLPRLHLIERSEGSLDDIEAFLINKPTWQQEQVYKRLNIWNRCAIMDGKTFAVCRLLASPSLAHDGPEWACRYIRRTLGSPEPIAAGPRRKIYVARGRSAHRSVINEQEACVLLRSYGFEIVDCSSLGVEDQAAIFAQSAVILGVHGAALSNLVFCSPGTVVLEIFGTPENQKLYWLISHHMQLRYYYLMAGSSQPGPMGNMADIAIDLTQLERSVEAILEITAAHHAR
jgi:hypothetical protein